MRSNSSRFWDELYETVLRDGEEVSPRGRKTLEVTNAMYQAGSLEHFDDRSGRNISLPYIFREFLWFVKGDRFDTRMTEYAPLWRQCVDPNGGINSNYGQYLFGPQPGFDCPFFHALDHIVKDRDSRRAWIAIFQEWHQQPDVEWDIIGDELVGPVQEFEHPEVPCTTGMGFRLRNGELLMNVHMRSQDLWHGAANDEGVCYLLQLMAVAYLNANGVDCVPGPITHYVDSLHFYERHWDKARAAIGSPEREEVKRAIQVARAGFTTADLRILRGVRREGDEPGPLLKMVLDIPGILGIESGEFIPPPVVS